MHKFDEGEEVFFDSVDCLSFEDSVVVKEELIVGYSEYEIWMKEPLSVKERRENFLCGMDFVEFAPIRDVAIERTAECSDAVVGSSISCSIMVEENLVSTSREVYDKANFLLDELEHDGSDNLNSEIVRETTGSSPTNVEEFRFMEEHSVGEESDNGVTDKKKSLSWWKRLLKKQNGRGGVCVSEGPNPETPKMNTMKVRQNNKRCVEFSAVYVGQEIQAHKGFIWTMKFSPDGQFLASGGEDGVVRIWRVTSVDASSKSLAAGSNFSSKMKVGKSTFGRKESRQASVVIPNKIFQIEESPLQEFHGHASDVLDMAWSRSNCLLSSSKDKTVRLWQVGRDECLNVYQHNNYVTCIQFNPIDDNYFVSGSIDGKVRIWSVSEGRVVGWADVRDVVTAICYQPDGKGFVVGSISGICRFYESSGNHLQLGGRIVSLGRKKTSGNKITGIQFSQEEPHKVMITSEDSKVRIFDGIDIVHKYRGLRNSGSQMSASFTSTGRHIISIGEDSRVYVWNYDGFCLPSSKQTKSVRSCEHFFNEGVSVAVPWSGVETDQHGVDSAFPRCLQKQDGAREPERFSLGSWFSLDGPCKGSATWPEEKLPLWDVPVTEDDYHYDREQHQQQQHFNDHQHTSLSETWGLVIVTANWDGTIRTFHNYGLPVRL